MPSEIPVIAIIVAAAVLAVLLVAFIFVKNYVKVPPDTAAIFYGRGPTKIVRGGAKFRIPGVQQVKHMSLEPFNVDVTITDVYSSDNVPVNVSAIGLIRFGSTEEMLAASTERFLSSGREGLHKQLEQQMSGSLRNIVSRMTIEQLNNDREQLTANVLDEAAARFRPIGMQLDVLSIQSISDNVGYLDALGKKRTAQVKSEATIGEAEAQREADIRSAQAKQAGQIAKFAADQAIADAEQELQLRRAAIQEEVDAAQARASQAGPLAQADAQRAVALAKVRTDQERTQAEISVERQRSEKAKEATQADIVIPAEADRAAAVLRAQGEREASIARSEAEAKQRELQGQADAQARTVAAQATQAELTAKAEGEKAQLLAQAAGQKELAAALKEFTTEAARLQVLPQLIEALPRIVREMTAPMGNIDKIVLVDSGSGNGGNAMTRFADSTTAALPRLTEVLGALGISLPAMLGQNGDGSSSDPASNGHTPVVTIPVTSDEPSTSSPN